MNSNLKRLFLYGAVSACATFGVSGLAYSQSNNSKEDKPIDEIMVIGVRGALKQAIDVKRASNAVVDALSSEDVGRFPDSDVGEALARIPGVSVSRQFGQGQQVSVRGASAQMTMTLLNGQTVASTGWYDQQDIDRSFNYTLLPPELVDEIKVYKSSQADLPEGGVGGTVIVKTRKPLNIKANTAYGSIKSSNGSVSGSSDPELSGLYSWKNDSNTFGALVSFAQSDISYERRGNETLLGWGQSVVPSTFQQDRERSTLNIAAQIAPSDKLQFGLNIMNMELVGDNTNTSGFIFPNGGTCESTNASGTCTFWRVTPLQAAQVYAQTWARVGTMTSDTTDLDMSYIGDGFSFKARVGKTEAAGGTDLTANYGWFIGAAADTAGTYNATGNRYQINIAKNGWTVADFTAPLSSAEWAIKRQPNSDEESYAQFDIDFDVDMGAIKAIKTGLRSTDHSVWSDTDKGFFAAPAVNQNASAFYSGTLELGMNNFMFPQPKLNAMVSDTLSQVGRWVRERPGYGTIEEESLALYLMAEYETGNVRGNFGIRYIETDASSDYYAFDASVDTSGHGANGGYNSRLSTDSASYDDVLPSFNMAVDLSDDKVFRVSAAKVISRPNYTDMFSRTAQGGYADGTPNNERLVIGNIGLSPFEATQADFSYEWYYADAAMLSATLFYKDISNFTTRTQTLNQSVGIVDPDSGVDNWTVIRKVDGSGAEITGLELQWQNSWDNGFGTVINFTFADATAPASNYPDLNPVPSDSSETSYNLLGYWENDIVSVRLAHNWRSEFMIRESGFYGNRLHEDFGTWDLSADWNVTDAFTLSIEWVNIAEEDSIQTGIAPLGAQVVPELQSGFPAWSFQGESFFRFDASMRF